MIYVKRCWRISTPPPRMNDHGLVTTRPGRAFVSHCRTAANRSMELELKASFREIGVGLSTIAYEIERCGDSRRSELLRPCWYPESELSGCGGR